MLRRPFPRRIRTSQGHLFAYLLCGGGPGAVVCSYAGCLESFLWRSCTSDCFCPWNGFLTHRIMHYVSWVFNSFWWVLPFLLFYASFEILVKMFAILVTETLAECQNGFSIATLRKEHLRLCETVFLADSLFPNPFDGSCLGYSFAVHYFSSGI